MLVIRDGQDPVQIRTGNNEFQISILVGCLLWGASSLVALGRTASNSVRAMPLWSVYLFFAALAVGALVTLTGIVYECVYQQLRGFDIERVGLAGLAFLCSAYAVWSGAANGPRAVGFVLLMAAITIASALRAWRITKDLATITNGDRR